MFNDDYFNEDTSEERHEELEDHEVRSNEGLMTDPLSLRGLVLDSRVDCADVFEDPRLYFLYVFEARVLDQGKEWRRLFDSVNDSLTSFVSWPLRSRRKVRGEEKKELNEVYSNSHDRTVSAS